MLTSNGYKLAPEYDLNDKFDLKKLGEQDFIKEGEHQIRIKIQWKLPEVSFTFPTDLDSFGDEGSLRKIMVNNYEVTDFAIEDLFLILSVYMAGTHWRNILWIFDLGELVRK